MDPQQQQPQNYGQFVEQPVAYDQYGNPLYAHPIQQPQMRQPMYAQPYNAPGENQHHTMRQPDFSPEAMRLHDESVIKYPSLNLSKGEYVLRSVKRHPVGIVKIWAIAGSLVAGLVLFLVGFLSNESGAAAIGIDEGSNAALLAGIFVLLVSTLVVIGGLVATYVYNSNKFYLTNESIIQEVRETIFARFDQTVILSNIEDVSYHQDGILASIFNYGVIRLSTVGDESTYRFTYVADPRRESAILNNAVESYKRGIPIDLPDDANTVVPNHAGSGRFN